MRRTLSEIPISLTRYEISNQGKLELYKSVVYHHQNILYSYRANQSSQITSFCWSRSGKWHSNKSSLWIFSSFNLMEKSLKSRVLRLQCSVSGLLSPLTHLWPIQVRRPRAELFSNRLDLFSLSLIVTSQTIQYRQPDTARSPLLSGYLSPQHSI